MSIGDINSTERGSGARFNDGKAPVELIPLDLIAATAMFETHRERKQALRCLENLGGFQRTGQVVYLEDATRDLRDESEPPSVVWKECAAVFDYGRGKYREWNWAKGMKWSVPLACAARHLLAIIDGEYLDPESKLPHRGHVMCNLVMLMQYQRTYQEGDDLPRELRGDPASLSPVAIAEAVQDELRDYVPRQNAAQEGEIPPDEVPERSFEERAAESGLAAIKEAPLLQTVGVFRAFDIPPPPEGVTRPAEYRQVQEPVTIDPTGEVVAGGLRDGETANFTTGEAVLMDGRRELLDLTIVSPDGKVDRFGPSTSIDEAIEESKRRFQERLASISARR